MLENSTLNDNITFIIKTSSKNYDTNGAIMFIVVVLFWYSVGIVLTLGMQFSTHSGEVEDSTRRRTRLFIRNLKDQNNTKEILGDKIYIVFKYFINY